MLQKKFIKLISVFVAVIIALNCFIFTTSAETYEVDFKYESFQFKNIRLWWTTDSSLPQSQWTEYDFYDEMFADFYQKDGYVFITLYQPNLPSDKRAVVRIEFDLLYGNTSDDRFNELSFDWLWHEKFQTEYWSSANYCYRVLHDGSHYKGTADYITGQPMPSSLGTIDTGRGFHFDYGQSTFETQTVRYGFQHSIYFSHSGEIKFCISNTLLRSGELSTQQIIDNQNKNTDKLLNAGSNVEQPDFDNTNNNINNTVGQIDSIEGQYKIDETATQDSLNEGVSFLTGSNMQKASIQVKSWIESFSEDNVVITGFFIACMCLGLCFWVIGRKAGSG